MSNQLGDLLAETITAARERERFFIDRCEEGPPDGAGRWRVKDHVAHLTSWREHASEVLEGAARGEAPSEEFDIDTRNAETFARTKDLPVSAVVERALRSYERLLSAISACDEDGLRKPRRGRPGEVWKVVPGNGHVHTGEHLIQWHLEQSDVAAAEDVAEWVHNLDMRFSEPGSQAEAIYNRACFLAKMGHDDAAVEHLRRSLDQGSAALRVWAREDGDLVTIRGRADVQAMLAG